MATRTGMVPGPGGRIKFGLELFHDPVDHDCQQAACPGQKQANARVFPHENFPPELNR
jgi:hypothetical protein